MRSFQLTLVAVVAASLTLTGCNTQDCTENRSAVPLAQFKSGITGLDISVDSLQVWGIGAPGDSALLSPKRAAQQVYLPLRSAQTQTSFCFAYRQKHLDRPELNDTLTLSYTAHPWFAGADCGAMYRYRITGVRHTHHLMDSVAVSDSLITNIATAQLSIYFKTASANE